ncbi:hypothetical protein VNI00_017984 [Paramarasmius palmivorus]|uniref:DUF6589 domain-containing protein n=1 Tax=Paramarasmius palmivorus TaxID=297713 RepID=A0AAW0B247_9AGAR
MPPSSKKRRNSETNYQPPGSFYKPKRPKLAATELEETNMDSNDAADSEYDNPIITSSAPDSPRFYDDGPRSPIDVSQLSLPNLPSLPFTPTRRHDASSLTSLHDSHATPSGSSMREGPHAPPGSSPLSILNPSPIKTQGGRPRVKKAHRNPRGIMEVKKTQEWQDKKHAEEALRAAEEADRKMKAAEELKAKKDAEKEARREAKLKEDTNLAHQVLRRITASRDEEGFGFDSLIHFFESALDLEGRGDDSQSRATMSRFLQGQAANLASLIFQRAPDDQLDVFLQGAEVRKKLEKEGQAIQELLSRKQGTKIHDLLDEFNLEALEKDLRRDAPLMWSILTDVSGEDGSRRKKELVLTTICAMISILRSQKSNSFQVVMGLFLLGSGASKREIDVFAHAGLSVAYPTVISHIKQVSKENLKTLTSVIKLFMCSLVWDNINFAFRVDSQRLNSKDHFDSGTAATLVVQWDPIKKQNAVHGTLPLSMKPPRETTQVPIKDYSSLLLPTTEDTAQLETCLIWQLKQIILEHYPHFHHLKHDFPSEPPADTEQIEPHTTLQYPLPAMHEDESTLDGTIKIYETLLGVLGMTDEELKAHGLVFVDGDLLTCSLIDKAQSARRNSTEVLASLQAVLPRFGLFHCKMAGCRMCVNEHWGKPNSPHPGGLWWENTNLLKRKNLTAGWQSKKASPWKPSHELIQISLAAHIQDAFRIHCEDENFEAWAKKATMEQFDALATRVYNQLFTSKAYQQEKQKEYMDTVLCNNILYNCDALFYWLFVTSIKAGNIGRVMLVLRVWMIMMRAPKTMPRYADAIFETLGRLQECPEDVQKLFLHNWLVNLTGKPNRFKEVDLLQEHQNFWLKAIYAAKGSNASWEWLSMISVCIYTLREALRSVQKAYKTPMYGTKHTVPDMSKEIQCIAEALKDENIQVYVPDRPANRGVDPVRDLMHEGVKYGNKRSAFTKYQESNAVWSNHGSVEAPVQVPEDVDMANDEGEDESYEPSKEDLADDDEEPYDMQDYLISLAIQACSE